jgi:predicted AAA+ superfamily ATPase
MTALEPLQGLVAIDEIQRLPDLFPLMRHLVDQDPRRRYLVLGSASRDLIRQGSETLAGRIAYHVLGGFRIGDVEDQQRLWTRGGFPRSYLARDDSASDRWRSQYVTTFLERDIPQLGIRVPAPTLRRFWTMLAHWHGQILNSSELATSFGTSDKTIRHYLEILEGAFMVRLLQPWVPNLGKRMVKSPKIYLRDSGIFHGLLRLRNFDQILSHPKLGASWEGFALEQCVQALGLESGEAHFWRPHDGSAELDLFFLRGGRGQGVEFKFADAPTLTRSMSRAIELLELERLWVVYPGREPYELGDRISVLPLAMVGRMAEA